MDEGKKYDAGKPSPVRHWLIPQEWIEASQHWENLRNSMPHEHHVVGAARAMAFGAEKYGWDNWKTVDNAVRRYADAALRHRYWEDWYGGGKEYDEESGLHHFDHACACIAFVLWFLEEGKGL